MTLLFALRHGTLGLRGTTMEPLDHFATIERVGGKAMAEEYRRALENGHIEELLKRMENDLAKTLRRDIARVSK
jgi:hypothetical protein